MRCNNIRFIGIPEGKEVGDMAKFLDALIPKLLDIEVNCKIEHPHRVGSQDRQYTSIWMSS